MTDISTPTVRYWRYEDSGRVIASPLDIPTEVALADNPNRVEVVVMTPDELAAIKAEVRRSVISELRAKFGVTNRAADYLSRSTESED